MPALLNTTSTWLEQAESLVREVSDLFSMPDVAHHAVHIEPLGTQVVHRLPKSRLVNVP